jgi:hypothetical protein
VFDSISLAVLPGVNISATSEFVGDAPSYSNHRTIKDACINNTGRYWIPMNTDTDPNITVCDA